MDYLTLGKLTSISVVQNGPGLPIFMPAVYQYIPSGDYLDQAIDDSLVPYYPARDLLSKVNWYDERCVQLDIPRSHADWKCGIRRRTKAALFV